MPIYDLPMGWIVLLNILLWLVIHLGMSYVAQRLPDSWFEQDNLWYQARRFESIRFYERRLKIKTWKKYLPDGARLFQGGFEKRNLQERSLPYYRTFVRETRRAEFAHLIQILPVALFVLFNPPWAMAVLLVYSLAMNLPCMITQRYNRLRFTRLIEKSKQKTAA
jgi:glycosyl-4,4'-diaponeurosporenoate acyltransferase